jgi:predicted regulator of Ras-like GTPase activity (Roadblock/LC7/MglB family)
MADSGRLRVKGILAGISGALGAAVFRKDGILVASTFDEKTDTGKLGKMSATMMNTADACSAEMRRGKLSQLILEADSGKFVALSAGDSAFILCMLKPDAALGPVLLSLSSAATQVADELK